MVKRILSSFWPAMLTLGLIGGVIAQTRDYPTAQTMAPYHQRVAEAIRNFPTRVGLWEKVEEAPLSYTAEGLLNPNVTVSRVYQHSETGRRMRFMFYQCGNAEYMTGHYPPVCYPASGWTMRQRVPDRWNCGREVVDGVEYTFQLRKSGNLFTMVVANLIVLPNGRIITDNEDLQDFAANRRQRFYGAAQIQMAFEGVGPPPEQRKRAYEQFLTAAAGAVEVIKSGVPR